MRAVAAVLVVVLHASLPYMLAPFPGLAWPVHDRSPSPWVDALGWWIDAFVMPLFLLMAGFFAARLMLVYGPERFLNHRTKRVLGPLAFGVTVLLPAELYLWLLGWVGQGEISPVKLKSLKIDSPHGDHLWGLSHLWFLEYLYGYCLLAWLIARFLPTRREPRGASWLSPAGASASWLTANLPRARHVLPWLGGLVAGLLMCGWPRILIGFHHGWLPHPANFVCFGLIFAAGWWLSRLHQQGWGITQGCETWLVAGLVLFLLSLEGVRAFAAAGDPHAPASWTTAVPFGMAGWLTAWGWWGCGLKYLRRKPPPWVGYLAEASFWIYLVHHPLVGLLHINLASLRWPAEWKCITAATTALALSLMTYETLVRRTTLGTLLNGSRRSLSTAPASSQLDREEVPPISTRRAA